jgi:CRISPR-associated protein Cmr2
MRENTTKTLHFNFTTVQSFVAQARRTRDLWAGSYLLSWLAGQAMAAIQTGGGKILMPSVESDKLIAAIKDPSKAISKDPNEKFSLVQSLGTLPNRFTAQLPENLNPDAYAKFVEDKCVNVIQNKWIKVANAVRNKIDPQKSLINDDFWNRQIENHWEFAWVIGEASNLLDTRKNLRLPRLNEESGEKCTVCGERQELSESKKTAPFKPDRNASKDWWAKLKEKESDLDLRENERLCAVCLTKRLFPLVAEQAIGWKVDPYYPSTAYLSAIDWLDKVLEKAEIDDAIRKAADELTCTSNRLNLYNSEYNTDIKCLTDHLAASGIKEGFLKLDGDVFYLTSIANNQLEKRVRTKGQTDFKLSDTEKNTLSNKLKNLQNAVGSSATPFYALLLMDGDGMGKLIGDRSEKERGEISQALFNFTQQVPDIVKKHNGRLVYAGGDDVFALLPVSTAIKCAADCRSAYQKAFDKQPEEIKKAATISAAVQFAHQNITLSVVVQDAHHLLDDIAKERTGRDALACRVWKPGGAILTWSQPWLVQHNDNLTNIDVLIDEVIADFKPDKQSDRFSSKFFYKLRDLFELAQSNSIFTETDIQDLLVAEYLANREHNWTDSEEIKATEAPASSGNSPEPGEASTPVDNDIAKKCKQAKKRIERLLLLCQQQTRIISENQEISYKKGKYNADAALLVRFLVQKEV